jgi:hypothetical protein
VSRPILFLDFDDVICLPEQGKPGAYDLMLAMHEVRSGRAEIADLQPIWDALFFPPAVENLRILHQEFGPTYVLSTSWTRFMDLASLEVTLRQGGLGFVAGALHPDWETHKSPGSSRANEIGAWLQAHPEFRSWVALDDTYSGKGLDEASGRVVICEVGKGFTSVELELARALFASPSPSFQEVKKAPALRQA